MPFAPSGRSNFLKNWPVPSGAGLDLRREAAPLDTAAHLMTAHLNHRLQMALCWAQVFGAAAQHRQLLIVFDLIHLPALLNYLPSRGLCEAHHVGTLPAVYGRRDSGADRLDCAPHRVCVQMRIAVRSRGLSVA